MGAEFCLKPKLETKAKMSTERTEIEDRNYQPLKCIIRGSLCENHHKLIFISLVITFSMQNRLIIVMIVDFKSTCCWYTLTLHLAVVEYQTLQILLMCNFTFQTRRLEVGLDLTSSDGTEQRPDEYLRSNLFCAAGFMLTVHFPEHQQKYQMIYETKSANCPWWYKGLQREGSWEI